MSFAQVDASSELYKIIRSNDSILFNEGFNKRDVAPFEEILSDNFEMYHDEAGLIGSKAEFMKSIENLRSLNYKPIRKLNEKSLRVYPLEKNGVLYGAIETGTHRFFALEKNKPKYLTSTATFTHVWMLEGDKWKLRRVLSYDHQKPFVPNR